MYEINKWNEYFENNESRKLKHLRWFPCPNKFDGLTYRKIVAQKDATDLFCAWVLLLEIASKSEPRGILGKSPDTPGYSPEDMELMTGFPAKIFKTALNFFSNNDIGWIINESPEVSGNNPDVSGKSPAVLNDIELNGKERKEQNINTAPSAVLLKSVPKENSIAFTIDDQDIPGSFWQKIVSARKNHYDAGLLFLRAHEAGAKDIKAWIIAGVKGPEYYALKACMLETTDTVAARHWVENNILKYED